MDEHIFYLVVLPRTRELHDLVLLKKAVLSKKMELEQEKGKRRWGGRDKVKINKIKVTL
jgi:hypothetical protein